MKKILLTTLSLLVLASCSRGLQETVSLDQQENQQQEIKTLSDTQAESTVNEEKDFIASSAESLFLENFADDIERPLKNVTTLPTNMLSTIETKGGMIFNTLNKSKFAQKVGYFFADAPVKRWMNKPSKSDSTPRITSDQITQMKALLKPGDMILCGNNNSFVHAILYLGDDVIVHSLASKGKDGKVLGVIRETLGEYLFRSERDKFVVLRYKNFDPEEMKKVADYANKQIGKTYDTLFLMNSDTRFYCTELVYQSLMQLTKAPKMFPHKVKLGWKLITNEDFMDSPEFETVWSLNKNRPATGKLHQY